MKIKLGLKSKFTNSIQLWFLGVLFFMTSMTTLAVRGAETKSVSRCETVFKFQNFENFNIQSLPFGKNKNDNQKAIGDFQEPVYTPTGAIWNHKNTRSLNQCRSDECYLFAFLGALEVRNQNHQRIKKSPQFSGAYLFAQKLLNYSDGVIQFGQGNTYHALNGGHIYDAIDLVKTHGLVPEESWQPKVPFEDWDFAHIYQTIDQKGFELNQNLGNLIQQYGYKSTKVSNAYQKSIQELHSLIYTFTGYIPETLNFRNQTLTPREIEQMYGIDQRLQITMMYPKGKFQDEFITTRKLNDLTSSFGTPWKYSAEDYIDIETKMMKTISTGAPAIIDIDWPNGGGHTMVVVDYETINGKLSKWKVKNSWGDSYGEQGYAWYNFKDVRKNLRRVWIFENQ